MKLKKSGLWGVVLATSLFCSCGQNPHVTIRDPFTAPFNPFQTESKVPETSVDNPSPPSQNPERGWQQQRGKQSQLEYLLEDAEETPSIGRIERRWVLGNDGAYYPEITFIPVQHAEY